MAVRSMRVLGDFGRGGIDPSKIDIEYDSGNAYKTSKVLRAKMESIWKDTAKPEQEDNQMLNYVGISYDGDKYKVAAGPTSFMDYFVMSTVSNSEEVAKKYKIYPNNMGRLQSKVRGYSTFPLPVTSDGMIVMGVKGQKVHGPGVGKTSVPGAGFSDYNKDTTTVDGRTAAKPLDRFIARKLYEDLGLGYEEIGLVKRLGIFRDEPTPNRKMEDVHMNPAFFSVVNLRQTSDQIADMAKSAPKKWKHDQIFFVPKGDLGLISSMADSDYLYGEGRELSDEQAGRIKNIGDMRKIRTTAKSGFMLHLYMRELGGNELFRRELDRRGYELATSI